MCWIRRSKFHSAIPAGRGGNGRLWNWPDAHLLVKGLLFQWRFILEQEAPASGGFLCAAGSRQLLPSTGVLQQTVPPSADATPHVTPPNAATPTNFSAASLWISFGFYKLQTWTLMAFTVCTERQVSCVLMWFTRDSPWDSWLDFKLKLTGCDGTNFICKYIIW